MNKKNIESFINRWSLNSHGQLCHNNGSCKNIAVLDTNSNRICSIESDTLNCNDITTTPSTPADGGGGGNGGGNGGGGNCQDSTAGILTITHSDGNDIVNINGSIKGFQVNNMNITYSAEVNDSEMNLSSSNGTYLGFDFGGNIYTFSELFTINELTDTGQSKIIITDDNDVTLSFNVTKEGDCYIITQI